MPNKTDNAPTVLAEATPVADAPVTPVVAPVPVAPALVPAPNATRCEAGGGSCGAGQPLYRTGNLIICFTHAGWPASKEGRIAAAVKTATAEVEKGG